MLVLISFSFGPFTFSFFQLSELRFSCWYCQLHLLICKTGLHTILINFIPFWLEFLIPVNKPERETSPPPRPPSTSAQILVHSGMFQPSWPILAKYWSECKFRPVCKMPRVFFFFFNPKGKRKKIVVLIVYISLKFSSFIIWCYFIK